MNNDKTKKLYKVQRRLKVKKKRSEFAYVNTAIGVPGHSRLWI